MIVHAVYAVDAELGQVHAAYQLGAVVLGTFCPSTAPTVHVLDLPPLTAATRHSWRTAGTVVREHAARLHPGLEVHALPGIVPEHRPTVAVDSDPTPPHGIPRPTRKAHP